MTPNYFNIEGFEIKSGTSQSAPYVSALAALLKGMNPDLKTDQVIGKILQSTREQHKEDEKTVLFGKVSFSSLTNNEDVNVVYPVFKELSQLKVDVQTHPFTQLFNWYTPPL